MFCYTLALHLLIMGVLARWSHGHSQTLAATQLMQAQQVLFALYLYTTGCLGGQLDTL